MMKFALSFAAFALSVTASPALAADTILSSNAGVEKKSHSTDVECSVSLPIPNAVECAGYFDQNLLGGSDDQIDAQIDALAELGYTYDGDWSTVSDTVVTSLTNGNQIDFGQTLYGLTYIGAHFGNVAGPAGNVTVFWAFDFGTEGVNSITLSETQGFSNAILFATGTPAVPEPSTWIMLLLGFFAAGGALRNKRSIRAQLSWN